MPSLASNSINTTVALVSATPLMSFAAQAGVSYPTAWRWCRLGLMLPTGDRIRLRYSRVGRQIRVAAGELERWNAAIAEADRVDNAARAEVDAG